MKNPFPGQNNFHFEGTVLGYNMFLNANPKSVIELTASYYEYASPLSGTMPPGVTGVSEYYWIITSSEVIDFSNGQVEVSLDSLRGVSDATQLVWLKRENPGDPWNNIGGTITAGNLVSIVPFTVLSEFCNWFNRSRSAACSTYKFLTLYGIKGMFC